MFRDRLSASRLLPLPPILTIALSIASTTSVAARDPYWLSAARSRYSNGKLGRRDKTQRANATMNGTVASSSPASFRISKTFIAVSSSDLPALQGVGT